MDDVDQLALSKVIERLLDESLVAVLEIVVYRKACSPRMQVRYGRAANEERVRIELERGIDDPVLNTSASHLVGHNVKHNEGTQAVRKHANRTRESRMLLHKFLVMTFNCSVTMSTTSRPISGSRT